jgi:flagellar biogenesis protein FliO
MLFVLIALGVFLIGTVGLVKWAIHQPSLTKTISSIIFVLTLLAAIAWTLKEFT